MATYRNKQDDTIIRGSEFKLNISIDSKGEYHMSDVVFTCTFMCGGKSKTLTKSDMRAIYEEGKDYSDNYVAPLDTNDFGKGVLTIRYIADIRYAPTTPKRKSKPRMSKFTKITPNTRQTIPIIDNIVIIIKSNFQDNILTQLQQLLHKLNNLSM